MTLPMGSGNPSEPIPRRFAPPLISSTTGGLRGNVTGSNGCPISHVEVRITHQDGRTWRTTTGGYGEFMAGRLPPGVYTVVLAKPELQPGHRPVCRVLASTWLTLHDLHMVNANACFEFYPDPRNDHEFPYTTGATFAPAELAGIPLR